MLQRRLNRDSKHLLPQACPPFCLLVSCHRRPRSLTFPGRTSALQHAGAARARSSMALRLTTGRPARKD